MKKQDHHPQPEQVRENLHWPDARVVVRKNRDELLAGEWQHDRPSSTTNLTSLDRNVACGHSSTLILRKEAGLHARKSSEARAAALRHRRTTSQKTYIFLEARG